MRELSKPWQTWGDIMWAWANVWFCGYLEWRPCTLFLSLSWRWNSWTIEWTWLNMAEHGWSRNTGSEKTELRDREHHRHTAYLGDCPHSSGSFILRDPWRRQWLGSCPLRLEIFDVIWMVGLSIELVGHHHSSSKILRDPPLANPSYPVIRLTMG